MSIQYSERPRKDGTIVYKAQIRIQKNKKSYSLSKTSTDRRMLEMWAERKERELKTAEPAQLENGKHKGTTIGVVLQWYLDDFDGLSKFGRSKLSHINYLINNYDFASLDAVNLKPQQLIKHTMERAKEASPSTINNDLVWLRNAFRSARLTRDAPLNLQVIDDAVALLRQEKIIARSKQRDRRPTLEELNKLLDYCSSRDGRAQLPMTDIILFALFSSRRQEEICTIRWNDLDERRSGVLVRDMKHPNKKIDTFVHLVPEAWAVINRQEKTNEIIFPYNSRSVSSAFARCCKFLEIEDLRFHDLRHECVSWLFELHWDIPRVSNVSGHKSWSSLQRYTHLSQHEKHDKYEGWKWRPA